MFQAIKTTLRNLKAICDLSLGIFNCGYNKNNVDMIILAFLQSWVRLVCTYDIFLMTGAIKTSPTWSV